MKLDTVHVLYICNEINLSLIYKETFDKYSYEKNDNDLLDSFNSIIDNLRLENLSVIDDVISLSSKRFCFNHIHKIEDESKTLFQLLYIDNIDALFKKIKKYNNIAYYDIDKAFDNFLKSSSISSLETSGLLK